jgi:hypothetical protein
MRPTSLLSTLKMKSTNADGNRKAQSSSRAITEMREERIRDESTYNYLRRLHKASAPASSEFINQRVAAAELNNSSTGHRDPTSDSFQRHGPSDCPII